MKMKSKTVIITGGGKGIGFGVATAFAKEGADIVITGRQESALAAAKEKLESAYGIRVGYVAGDLGQEETAPKVVAKAIEMTGRLDVLINNAQASKSGVDVYKRQDPLFAPSLHSDSIIPFPHCSDTSCRDKMKEKQEAFMIVLRQADVYAPQFAGRQDILIAGGEIVRMAQHLDCGEAEEIDARGKIAVPGLIDQHIHITGGGGEGSFHTKTPEVQLSSLIEGGITTAVGLLGTDGFSRSVENLVSKAKALKEEGLSVYCLTGSYSYPSVTLTGDVKKDILFIDEILGVKLAPVSYTHLVVKIGG